MSGIIPYILNHRAFVPLYSLLIFLWTYFVFGFYYETNDDVIFILLSSGILSGEAITNFYQFHHGWASLYAFLYSITDAIPWYGIIMCGLLWLAAIQVLYLLKNLFKESHTVWWMGVGTLLLLGIFIFNLVFFNFTRIAILLAGSSLLLFISELKDWQHINRKRLALYSWLIFAAFLMRPLSVLICGGLLAPLVLYYLLDKKISWNLAIRAFIPLLTLIAGFYLYQHFNRNAEDRAYMERVAYFLNIHDRRHVFEPANESPQDSSVRWAIQNWFVGDREIVTKERLASISTNQLFYTRHLTSERKQKLYKVLKKQLKRHSMLLWGMGLLIVVFIIVCVSRRKWGNMAYFVLYQCFFWGVILLLAHLIKMPNRLLVPYLLVYALSNLCLFAGLELRFNKWWQSWPLLLLAVVAFIDLDWLPDRSRELEKSRFANEMVLKDFDEVDDKTIVFTTPTYNFFEASDPLKAFELKATNDYLLNFGWSVAMPSYYQDLEERFNSENFLNFYQGAVGNQEVIFVSDHYCNTWMSGFFEGAYGLKLNFEETPTPEQIPTDYRGLRFYYLESISE